MNPQCSQELGHPAQRPQYTEQKVIEQKDRTLTATTELCGSNGRARRRMGHRLAPCWLPRHPSVLGGEAHSRVYAHERHPLT